MNTARECNYRICGAATVMLIGFVHAACYGQADCELRVTLTPLEQPVEGEVRDCLVSTDGRRLAYTIEANGQWVIVCEDRGLGPFDEIIKGTSGKRGPLWSFSPDARHFAVAVRKGWGFYLLVDGYLGPPVEEIDPAVLHYSAISAMGLAGPTPRQFFPPDLRSKYSIPGGRLGRVGATWTTGTRSPSGFGA
jgi:hypothetical protein